MAKTPKDDPAPDPHPTHAPPLDPTAPPPPGSAPMTPPPDAPPGMGPVTPAPVPGAAASGLAPGEMGKSLLDTGEVRDAEPLPTPPPPQVPPPTDAQYAWFAQHKDYVRISHSLGSYTNRGTLTSDGTYIPEGPGTPVIDGDGSFGVGTIPF